MWEISHLLLPASPFLPPPCQSWLPCCPWLVGWWSDLRLTFDDASQRLQVAMSRAWTKIAEWENLTHISVISYLPYVWPFLWLSSFLRVEIIKGLSFSFSLNEWKSEDVSISLYWSNPYLGKCITYLKRPLGSLASFVSSMLSPRKYIWPLS